MHQRDYHLDVFIEVLQADGGTRCAALTAASVALADAGIPMRDMVVAVAAGKVADTVILDVNNEEDQAGQADMPIGYMPILVSSISKVFVFECFLL